MLRENDIDKEMENEMWVEDFAEIDALLEKWSKEECEAPTELHQSIMGALSSVSPKKSQPATITPINNKKSNAVRYLAVAALAAGVLLASIAVDKISLDASYDQEPINSRAIVSPHTADLADVATCNEGTTQMMNDEFNETAQTMNKAKSVEIDWQYENEEKTTALENAQAALAHNELTKQQIEALESKIDWLEDCLEAIARQDREYYEELLLKSPDNE